MTGASGGAGVARGPVRGPQSLVSGLTLIALAAFALWLVSDLSQGTLRSMGPAMLPRWLAVGVGLCGVALVAAAFLQEGGALEAYTVRGVVLVVVGVLAFGATIRGLSLGAVRIGGVSLGPVDIPSLGMIVAGPLAILISGYATPEARLRELVIMALALTAACMLLFGDLLNLPIPLYPQALSDLFPAGWSSDARMRATAGLMVLAAILVYLPGRDGRPEPVDVVPDEHAGTI